MAATLKHRHLGLILLMIFLTVTTALEFDIYRHRNVLERANSAKKATSDSLTLYKYMNAEYYSIIEVGHPGKKFKVTFDTTWSDSWLPSQHCGYTQIACLIHNRYDSSKSSTYQEDGRPFDRSSKELSLSGFLSMDNFHLDHIAVLNQTFVEITKMSYKPFMMNMADGIIGLGFDKLAVPGTVPFFYNMLKQGVIEKPIFTFYMNRDATTEKAGKLLLGATERSHTKGNFTVLPVVEKKYWMVHMDSVIVDGKDKKSHTFCATGCKATFDTSSNQIIGPADEINKINNLLNAKQVLPTWPYRYVVDCREFAKLPHIHFVLGGVDHTIESKYYVQHLAWHSLTMCLSPFTVGQNDFWILGGAFLMQFYTEFDFQNGVVGIAETVF